MPLPLRHYQVEDLAFYIGRARCANLSDPGTGKTPSVCVYMDYLWSDLGVKSLWIMPKSLLQKNYDELLRFTRFQPEDLVILTAKWLQQRTSEAKVFLMTAERFKTDWKNLKSAQPKVDAILVDEIHMLFGGHSSQRTQALFEAMQTITNFLAMTGTLIDGRLDTAYPTIKVIEPRYYYDWYAFQSFHGLWDYDGNLVGWKNHAKLAEIFSRHAIRRSFESVFGAEKKVIIHKLCRMSPRQREVYVKFSKEAVLELEDRFLEGSLPGVNVIRCRQIMAHPENVKLPVAYDENNKPILKSYNLLGKDEVTGKDEALMVDLADHWNSGKPFVIYASLQPEQERIRTICEKFGFKTGFINGTVSGPERSRIDQAFRAGELQVLVGSPATAAVGFNWGHVDHVAFVSLDYKDTNFKQAYRRMMRDVRDKPLRISVFEYEKSIDQRIFEIVNRKSRDANTVDPTHEALSLGVDSDPLAIPA